MIFRLARLLLLDDDWFHRFDSLVPAVARDIDFFDKISSKVDKALTKLDEYAMTGLTNTWNAIGPNALETFGHDVPWCAQALVDLVEALDTFIQARSLNSTTHAKAASSLVYILQKVLSRNIECYPAKKDMQWDRKPPVHEKISGRKS